MTSSCCGLLLMVESGCKLFHLRGKAWLGVYLKTEPRETENASAEGLRHGGSERCTF
jgi:hypothetical protein